MMLADAATCDEYLLQLSVVVNVCSSACSNQYALVSLDNMSSTVEVGKWMFQVVCVWLWMDLSCAYVPDG